MIPRPQESATLLRRLVEHADAPRWTHSAGDRLDASDVRWLEQLRARLRHARRPQPPGAPRPSVLAKVAAAAGDSPLLRSRLPVDPEADWATIPTLSRVDIATRIESLIPWAAPLDEALIYRTAGTTGHALRVPHHRRSIAALLPLIEVALAAWGVTLTPEPDAVVCALLGAQADTVTYPCTLAGWRDAGFVKLNLDARQWPSPESAQRYLTDLSPQLLTGDPITFAALLTRAPAVRPRALLTTAVAMSARLRSLLVEHFGCPVVDWYSLTETGPIGFRCPQSGAGAPEAFHVVTHDLHVEALDVAGAPVADGQRGEITVTGGRNPFVPLLRYRTGDWGRLLRAPCPCGDPGLRIVDLEGRAPVVFAAHDGALVNPVDLAKTLRRFPLVCHELDQASDRRLTLRIRPVPGHPVDEGALRQAFAAHLGPVPLDVVHDPTLGDRSGKAWPWRSAIAIDALLRPEGETERVGGATPGDPAVSAVGAPATHQEGS